MGPAWISFRIQRKFGPNTQKQPTLQTNGPKLSMLPKTSTSMAGNKSNIMVISILAREIKGFKSES